MNSAQKELLTEQAAYYRARASEYDEWFYRRGRYDRGREANREWFRDIVEVRRFLRNQAPLGSILEPACGTGLWTKLLVRLGDQVTAVDASPEMLAINRSQVGDPRVHYQKVDLFNWAPGQTWDTVFVSFWLSHVPPDLLDEFLDRLASWVAPKGRLILLDSRYAEASTALNHHLGREEMLVRERKLNDGRSYRIMKVFYDPLKLDKMLYKRELSGTTQITDKYFLYGSYGKQEQAL